MSCRVNRSCIVVMFAAVVGCGPSIDGLDDFNLPPSVFSQFVTTDENVAVTIDPLAHASDYDGDPLTVSGVSAPAGHTATLVSNRSIRVTPKKDFTGTFTVTWTVSDGTHQVAGDADVYVSAVYGTPNPVVATGGTVTISGTTTIQLGATGGNQALWQFTILTGPTHGTLSGTPPAVNYTPQLGFVGDDRIEFQVSDGQSTSSATLTLHVTGYQAPTAFGSSSSGVEDGSIQLFLNANGSTDHPLTYNIVRTPEHGTLSGTAPSLTYTPAANFNGFDSLRFSVSDGTSTSAIATVSLTVQPVNDAPTAAPQTVTVTEDISGDITLVGSDIDGDSLTYIVGTNPAHGALTGSPPNLTYHPAANYHGPDSFTFTVRDPSFSTSAPATVSITVDSVEDLPLAEPFARSLAEDTATPITLLGGDGDGDPVSYAFTQPAHGTLTGNAPALTYTPATNFNGTDSFTYTVSGSGITSAPATVSLTVTPVNDPPVASNGEVTTAEDTAVAIALQATDIDSSSLTFSITVPPADGTLSGFGTSWTYTPARNATGDRSFTFRVSDGGGASATGVVTIHITPVNDPPTAVDDFVMTQPGTPITFSVTANDSDPEGDPLQLDSAEAAAHGEVEIVDAQHGQLRYTPHAGFAATDVFSYTVVDALGASAVASVHVGVGTYPPGAPAEAIAVVGGPVSINNLRPPAISADDRFVAFTSSAALVSDDTNGLDDIYLYDRTTRSLTRASTASDGSQGNAASLRPQLSGDGRYVVFDSAATNLVAGDTNGKLDVFRHDRVTGETLRISVSTAGAQGTGQSADAHISEDGNLVAFTSNAFELVANDANGVSDIFVRNVAAGTTTRVSTSTLGGDAELDSTTPVISGNGRYVAFLSMASNLVANDGNGARDVFLRDLVAGTTTRMNVTSTGGEATGGIASMPSISRDGRFVAFLSTAPNLVTPASSSSQLLVHDTQTLTTTRSNGSAGLIWARLSGDGRYAAAFFGTTFASIIYDRFAGTSVSPLDTTTWLWPVLSSSGRYIVVFDSTGGGRILVVPNPL